MHSIGCCKIEENGIWETKKHRETTLKLTLGALIFFIVVKFCYHITFPAIFSKWIELKKMVKWRREYWKDFAPCVGLDSSENWS